VINVKGITSNPEFVIVSDEQCGNCYFIESILGYEKLLKLQEALRTGTVYQIVVEEQMLISDDKWQEIYSLENSSSRFVV
jgi:hypothetical protein